MKKGLILFVALTLLTAVGAFAKVTVVKDGDAVKVTWTYTNADAGSVGLVGDFQGWNLAGASPMTKGADGVWSITLTGKPTSEYKYKFNVDGEWTEDPEAPAGTDDGFGGTNGFAVVADLLAGSGDASAPKAARGLNVGVFDALWLDTKAATKNAVSGVKGYEVNDITLNHKAYVKADGYIFPELLYTAFEFKWFDGPVQLYKKELVYNTYTMQFDPTVTTDFGKDGLKNLANLPFSMFQPFGMDWPATKGKVRVVLELKDLDLKISHAVGWSKTTKQNVGGLFLTYFEDPDSNAGITELFPIKPLNLGGASLDYLVDLDKSGGNYKVGTYLFPTVAGLNIEAGATIDSKTNDLAKFGDAANTHLFLGAKGAADALSYKVQGKYIVDATNKAIDPYFAGLEVGYTLKDTAKITVKGLYAGQDAGVDYNGTNADNGLASSDNAKAQAITELSLINIPSLTLKVANTFAAAYKDFTAPADAVTAGVSYDANGTKAGFEAKLNMPVASGAKFSVDHISATAELAGLNAGLYYIPSVDFTTNEVRVKATYALSADAGLALGLGYVQDSNDANDPLGVTLGYNLMTPFEAVKKPVLFVTYDYNLSAMDGDDNHQMGKIDGDDFKIISGASLRTGLRWNF